MTALSALALPSGITFALFALGLLACLWRRTRPASWLLLAGSGLVNVVFSLGTTAAALMSPLDYTYPTVTDFSRYAEARHIVVLTGWASDDPLMPLSGRLNASSAYRVLMTLEVYRDRPDCDVIVSGDETTARIMGAILVKLGVAPDRLRLESRSTNTAESMAFLKPMLGDQPFFLVTSAGHLPRSMEAARKQGLQGIPVPTDHQMPKDWRRAEWFPRPTSLVVSDLAAHEYIGRLWYRLKGAI